VEILIRALEEKDYPAIISITHNALKFTRLTDENTAAHYSRIKDDDRYKTFVAVMGGETVGFISSVWSHSVGREVGFMHITAIAVDERVQGHGIGTKLLNHMEDYATSIGIDSILLTSGLERTEAHKFYVKNGYENRALSFTKSL